MELFLPIAHMDVNIVLILLYGALVGFLSGLVGVGGGFLITPLLIFTGIPPIVAVSSGAAQMAGTASGASYLHWRHGNIDFKMGLILLIGSWLGGGFGVYLAKVLLRAGQFGNVVVFLYVILLGFIGVSMLIESLRAVFCAGAPPRKERSAGRVEFAAGNLGSSACPGKRRSRLQGCACRPWGRWYWARPSAS